MGPDLDRLLAAASLCELFDDGMANGRPLADGPALTLAGKENLAQLRRLLRVRADDQDIACMCLGDATLRLSDDAGRVLATVDVHARRLRNIWPK